MTHRPARAVFLVLAFTYLQFFQAATWGSAVRLDLARALAERGTIRIDAYKGNTGDGAFFAGHYYSEKGPLASFLAVPGVAAAHGIRAAASWPKDPAAALAFLGGLAAFFGSGLAAALAAAVLARTAASRGAPPAVAAFTGFLAGAGTLLFPYGTVLQAHALVAAAVMVFFAAAFPARGAPGVAGGLLAGAAASAGLAADALAGPAFAILGALSLVRHRRVAVALALRMLAGAAPGLALLGLYHDAAFGSPFTFGYTHVALPAFSEGMGKGVFGIHAPDPVVAAKLLFGPYRGLFFACPVLLAAAAGLVLLARDPARRIDAIAAACVFAFYLLVTSGYYMWNGGWAIGPRHLAAAIPLLGLGLPAALARWPRVTCALGAVSVLFMLAAASVQPEVPEDVANPLLGHLLPHFVRGELMIGEQGFLDLYPARVNPAVPDRWDAFLLGELFGLRGALALLPVLAAWVIFVRRAARA